MSTFPFFPIASEELRGRSLVQALGATADTPLSRVRQIVGFPADSIGGSPWPASRLAFGCFVAVCVISLFSWNSLAGAYRRRSVAYPTSQTKCSLE